MRCNVNPQKIRKIFHCLGPLCLFKKRKLRPQMTSVRPNLKNINIPSSLVPTHIRTRDQWFWKNFINSMCGIKFWKGNEILRSVYNKNCFSKFWAVSSIFDLFQLSKKFIVPSKRWKLFSFNGSNGASKNPSFRTDFKNVYMTFVKSAPKKVLA